MKLRLKDNTLRLRVSKSEVETLNRDGLVSAATDFPGGRALTYQLESTPASVGVTAFYTDNVIRVQLPESVVRAWAGSEQISIAERQILVDGRELFILVEKDFACLSPRVDEDEADLYTHPGTPEKTC